MDDFFQNLFKIKRRLPQDTRVISEEDDNAQEDSERIAAGYVAADTARVATEEAARKFAKPPEYSEAVRKEFYEDGKAMERVKKKAFQNGQRVIDPYTGEELVLTNKEAEMLYGKKETSKHLATAEHIKPLKRVHADTKDNVWNTTEDIKAAANSDDNFRILSKSSNSSKNKKTNREYMEYLEEQGIQFTEEEKQAEIRVEESAEMSINRQLNKAAAKNIVTTGHNAGVSGAQNAGVTAATMAGITNIVAVIQGKKDATDAIVDTVKISGQAAATGYVMSGGLTVAAHSLSNVNSQFIQGLVNSNIPGQVITAVMVTGDTLKRYANGEISTQECLIDLGERGLNFATVGYSMAAGQALIPIPIVGGAIGALVGSALTSEYYRNLIQTLQTRQLEHQQRQRIIAECRIAAEQAQAYRMELEHYLESYFAEYRTCFDEALSSMRYAFQNNDANGVIAGANQITRKLGGQVHYNTVDEFRDYFNNTPVDVL